MENWAPCKLNWGPPLNVRVDMDFVQNKASIRENYSCGIILLAYIISNQWVRLIYPKKKKKSVGKT